MYRFLRFVTLSPYLTHRNATNDFHVRRHLGGRPHDHEGVEVEPHLADVIADGADLGGAGARRHRRGFKVGDVLKFGMLFIYVVQVDPSGCSRGVVENKIQSCNFV